MSNASAPVTHHQVEVGDVTVTLRGDSLNVLPDERYEAMAAGLTAEGVTRARYRRFRFGTVTLVEGTGGTPELSLKRKPKGLTLVAGTRRHGLVVTLNVLHKPVKG